MARKAKIDGFGEWIFDVGTWRKVDGGAVLRVTIQESQRADWGKIATLESWEENADNVHLLTDHSSS